MKLNGFPHLSRSSEERSREIDELINVASTK